MFRLAWLLAGVVIGYVASGYIEGFCGDAETSGESRQGFPEFYTICRRSPYCQRGSGAFGKLAAAVSFLTDASPRGVSANVIAVGQW